MPKIDGIIFDMDGTVLDSMSMWYNLCSNILVEMGLNPDKNVDDIAAKMTLMEAAQFFNLEYSLNLSEQEIINIIYSHIENFYLNEAAPKEGAIKLLAEIKDKDIPMVLATATDRKYTCAALSRNNMHHFFKEIFTCSEIGKGKSHPDIFLSSQRALGTSIEKTCVVEDSLYAIKTAKAAGFFTVGIYDKYSQKDKLEIKTTSDFYITSLNELGELLK